MTDLFKALGIPPEFLKAKPDPFWELYSQKVIRHPLFSCMGIPRRYLMPEVVPEMENIELPVAFVKQLIENMLHDAWDRCVNKEHFMVVFRGEMQEHQIPEHLQETLCYWVLQLMEKEQIMGCSKETFFIIVNGETKEMQGSKDELSYLEVVALVGKMPDYPSVTYSHARGMKHEGILSPGQIVGIKEGTIFSVCDTSNA
jgi:hypothetical protein